MTTDGSRAADRVANIPQDFPLCFFVEGLGTRLLLHDLAIERRCDNITVSVLRIVKFPMQAI